MGKNTKYRVIPSSVLFGPALQQPAEKPCNSCLCRVQKLPLNIAALIMSLVRISELLSSRLALASLASIVVSSALILRGRAKSAQKACSTPKGTQAVINLLHTFDRLQFEIDIGLPEEAVPGEAHDLCASTFNKPLMEAVNAISDITGGLSYQVNPNPTPLSPSPSPPPSP